MKKIMRLFNYTQIQRTDFAVHSYRWVSANALELRLSCTKLWIC